MTYCPLKLKSSSLKTKYFMKAQRQQLTYQELELITTSPIRKKASSLFLTILSNVWDDFLAILISNSEPQISQIIDSEGNLYWRICAPRTGQSIACLSKQEVRIWLEQYFSGQQPKVSSNIAPHLFPGGDRHWPD